MADAAAARSPRAAEVETARCEGGGGEEVEGGVWWLCPPRWVEVEKAPVAVGGRAAGDVPRRGDGVRQRGDGHGGGEMGAAAW